MILKILTFFIFSVFVFGDEVSLDDLLENILKNSYEKNNYRLEEEKSSNLKKLYKKGDFNGIKTSFDSSYDIETESYKSQGTATFGNFYLTGVKNNAEDLDLIVGINKNIKDLIYSENKSNLKKLEISKEMEENNYFEKLESKKIDLVDLYSKYKDLEFEKNTKENGLLKLKIEEQIIKKSYNMGKISKVEYDSLQVTLENLKLELETLEKNINEMRNQFFYSFDIDLIGKSLSNIIFKEEDIEEYISKVNNKRINNLELDIEKTKESIKYKKYDKFMPDLNLGVEYGERFGIENNKGSKVTLKISKDFFYQDSSLENEKINYKMQLLELENQKLEQKSEQIKLRENYRNYLLAYKSYLNKSNLEKIKYEINKKEYELGRLNYLEVIDSFNKYIDYEVAKGKAENKLNSYIYKIKIKGDR